MNKTDTLTRTARHVADLERRGDFSALLSQAAQAWAEAGGLAGYSAAGTPFYLRRDGRRIRDRGEAMASWAS